MDIQPSGIGLQSKAAVLDEAQRRPAPTVTQELLSEAKKAPQEQPEQLVDAVRTANKAIQQVTPGIEFSIDEDTGKMIVRVVDATTREVLRQIPSEEMLAIARTIDQLQGLLIKEEA